MISHIPNTTTICCHTLCVDKDFRGFSIGMKLLKEFTHMCQKRGIYDRMLFISKKKLLPVYEKIGFMTIGPAEVKLGNDVWYEMCINFRE
jgi:GNAT superfamily N-acetyltransferase